MRHASPTPQDTDTMTTQEDRTHVAGIIREAIAKPPINMDDDGGALWPLRMTLATASIILDALDYPAGVYTVAIYFRDDPYLSTYTWAGRADDARAAVLDALAGARACGRSGRWRLDTLALGALAFCSFDDGDDGPPTSGTIATTTTTTTTTDED